MRGEHLVGIVSRADLLRILIVAKFDATAPGDDAIRRSILTRLREDAGINGDELDSHCRRRLGPYIGSGLLTQ